MSDLRTRLETVDAADADGEQLVTVTVPPDGDLGEIRETVEEDRAEASYIDDEASKPLARALERTQDELSAYDTLPEKGLAVYAGVVDGELVTHTFDDLPEPVSEELYETANEFDTSPLAASVGETNTYGLVVVERGGAALGRYDGSVEALDRLDSDVPGKTKKGGQSEDRFENRREEQLERFLDDVADAVDRTFNGDEGRDPGRPEGGTDGTEWEDGDDPAVDALLLGGTEVTVERFRDDHLDRQEHDIAGTYTVDHAGEEGLRALVEAARDESIETGAGHDALDRFLGSVGTDDEPVVYGRQDVDDALTYEAVETLLVSGELDAEDAAALSERAEEQDGEAVVVPTDSEDGERFAGTFGGVAALLRFPIE